MSSSVASLGALALSVCSFLGKHKLPFTQLRARISDHTDFGNMRTAEVTKQHLY